MAGESPPVTLTALDLSNNQLGDSGVSTLAQVPWLAQLEVLALMYNVITDEGARAMLGSPHLEGIQALYLAGNTFTPPMRRQLVERLGPRVVL
jgi:hypothetical protein